MSWLRRIDELEDWIVVVRASSRILGARRLMPDIKCGVSDRTICVSCQEMPTGMEVAMDECVSKQHKGIEASQAAQGSISFIPP